MTSYLWLVIHCTCMTHYDYLYNYRRPIAWNLSKNLTTIHQDSSRLSMMLVQSSYNKATIGQDRSTISYNLHDDFFIGTGFWTCWKLLRWPHARWRFVKTYRDFPRVIKTCRMTSLYIVHDWLRLTGHWWSYRGRICSQIRCDPDFSHRKLGLWQRFLASKVLCTRKLSLRCKLST